MERKFPFMPYEVIYRLSAHYWKLLYNHKPFRDAWTALVQRRGLYPRVSLNSDQQGTLIAVFTILRDYPEFALLAEMYESVKKFVPSEVEKALYELYLEIGHFAKTHFLPGPIQTSVEYGLMFASTEEESLLLRGNICLRKYYVSPVEGRPKPPQLPQYEPLRDTRESYREKALQVVEQYIRDMEDFYRQAGWKGWSTLSTRLNEEYLETLARRVFMRVVERRSWSEIAAATNCSASTACETTQEGIRLLYREMLFESD